MLPDPVAMLMCRLLIGRSLLTCPVGTDVPPWMAVAGLPRAPAEPALFLWQPALMFSERVMLYGDRTLSIIAAILMLGLLIKAARILW